MKLQARIMWIDATANLHRINSSDKIKDLVQKIRRVGFNTIVLDIKPIVGFTLYPSRFAPRLLQWKDRTLSPDFDPLAEFITQAHAAGLQLFVCMNAFSEGHRDVRKGLAYDTPFWQTVLYEPLIQISPATAGKEAYQVSSAVNRFFKEEKKIYVYTDFSKLKGEAGNMVAVLDKKRSVLALLDAAFFSMANIDLPEGGCALYGAGDGARFLRENALPGELMMIYTIPSYVSFADLPELPVPIMVNPHNADVQGRLLNMVEEVVKNYAVDGIMFDDRFRYAAINADFSEGTRRAFEAYVGKPLSWPNDVFKYEVIFPTLKRQLVPGPYFDAWLVWRAATIRNFLALVVNKAKGTRPGCLVGTYVGSWYGEYPAYGANWASDDFEAGFRFLTDAYRRTGFASLLDFTITGCYYTVPTIDEAEFYGKPPGATVEAAGQLSNRVVRDHAWMYAGLQLNAFLGRPEALKDCMQAAAATTQGIMIFDLSHNIDQFWTVFQEAFREPARAPHAVPGLLQEVRKERERRKTAGPADPPVTIMNGVPGTGF